MFKAYLLTLNQIVTDYPGTVTFILIMTIMCIAMTKLLLMKRKENMKGNKYNEEIDTDDNDSGFLGLTD